MASQFEINRKAVKDYLGSQGMYYQITGEGDDLVVYKLEYFMRPPASCFTNLFVVANATEITSLLLLPEPVGEDARPQVAEYLGRANYGLMAGFFEMDYASGEVHSRSVLSCVNANPSQEDVRRVIMSPMKMFDQYGAGLMRVAAGTIDPACAFAEARRGE